MTEPRSLDWLTREHGRLVARLRRQARRAEGRTISPRQYRALLQTVTGLIVCERLLALDELEMAAAQRSEDRMKEILSVTANEIKHRLRLMTPGAGLVKTEGSNEVVSRQAR